MSSRISLWIANDVTHAVVMFSKPVSAHTDHSRATTSRELSTVKTLPLVAMPEQHVFSDAGPVPPIAQRRPRRSYMRATRGSTLGAKVPKIQLVVK